MRINCPCNEIVEPKIINGVIMYVHKDGTSCKTLNRFYKDKCEVYAWSVCKQAIEDNDYDTFNVYMCIATKVMRDRLLEYVRYMNKDELIKTFTFLFSSNGIRGDIQGIIAKDLIEEHGIVALNNIKTIMGEAFERNKSLSAFMKVGKKNSKMCDISKDVRIANSSVKQNIVEDLARSFLIDKAIRDSTLKNAIKSFSR